jgi:DHA1 family tetracycline resistance protein-like MFS transporter
VTSAGHPHPGPAGHPHPGPAGHPHPGSAGHPHPGPAGHPHPGSAGHPHPAGDPPSGQAPAGSRGALLAIFLTVVVDVLALAMVYPLIPFYAGHFHASDLQIGALFACYPACTLIAGPPMARLSDRFGRRPVLILSQVGTLIGLLIFGTAQSLPFLFLGRIIDGLTAGNLTVAQAYVTDVTAPENRTRAFALIGLAFGFGFLVGPAGSGWLANRYGYEVPALTAAALSAVSVVISTLFVREPARRESMSVNRSKALTRFFREPGARAHLLELFAYAFAFAQLMSGLGLFLAARFGYDVRETGYVFAFAGLIGGLTLGGIRRVAKRMGEAKLARYGFIGMALGYAGLAWAFDRPMLLAATAVGAIGGAVVRPAVTTLLTTSVGPGEHAEALGVAQSLNAFAQMTGSLCAGAILGAGHVRGWALVAGASALLGLVFGRSARSKVTNQELPKGLA